MPPVSGYVSQLPSLPSLSVTQTWITTLPAVVGTSATEFQEISALSSMGGAPATTGWSNSLRSAPVPPTRVVGRSTPSASIQEPRSE